MSQEAAGRYCHRQALSACMFSTVVQCRETAGGGQLYGASLAETIVRHFLDWLAVKTFKC